MSLSKYSLAVLDPFNPKALGARVPDGYSFPTETETFKAKFNVKCNTAFNADWFDLVFKCSLLDTVCTPAAQDGTQSLAFNTNATLVSLPATLPLVENQPDGYSDTWGQLETNGFLPSSASAIIDNNLTGGKFQWTKYRIVGGGVRLKSQMIPTTATGYLNFYSNPNSRVDYSNQLFTNTDFTAIDNRKLLATHTGRPYVRAKTPLVVDPTKSNQDYAIVLNETMSEEPDGEVVDALTFNAKGCEFAFRPVTNEAYEWRNITSAPEYDATSEQASTNSDGTANTFIGANEFPFDEAFFNCSGWNNLCVKGSALPAALGGSAITPILVAEVIFHVEYISSDIGISNHAVSQSYNQASLDQVAKRAAKMPLYRQLYSSSDSYNKIKRRAGFS